jgi:hypothetical protein
MFVHFLADWLMQTDSMAKRKASESTWMLVVHSATYAAMFAPLLYFALDRSVYMTVTSTLMLMMSHGAIDTYTPIWLWARFFRKPSEMQDNPVGGFTAWCAKPYGFTLTMGIDQFMHACFLMPVAAMVVLSQDNLAAARTVGLTTFCVSLGLAALSVFTVLFYWRKQIRPPEVSDEGDFVDDDDDRPSMPSQHDI